MFGNGFRVRTRLHVFMSSPSPNYYVWDVASSPLHTAGVRRDNRENREYSWSIKESDFARLMSFPSSFRREGAQLRALEKGYRYGDGRDDVSKKIFVIFGCLAVGCRITSVTVTAI